MTQLDEFTIDFKTRGASDARADIAALDKQIDSLTAKGSKRSEQENLQLQQAKRLRKDVTQELKEQQKQVDQLSNSFTKLIEGGAAIITAYAGYTALKTGIINASELNSALQVQAQITGQNAGELRALSAATEAAGGSAAGFISSIDSMTRSAADVGLPLTKVLDLMRGVHDNLQGLSRNEQRRRLDLLGIADPGMISLLEKSNAEFERSIEDIRKHADATNAALPASRAFDEQWSKTRQSFIDAYSALDVKLLPALTSMLKTLEKIGDWLAVHADHPVADFIDRENERGKARKIIGWNSSPEEVDAYIAAHPADSPASTNPPATTATAPAAQSTRSSGPALGIRSNNPGNLRFGGHEATYASPEAGLSALANNLRRYGRKGWNTIASIIAHWAPPSENDTAAYIAAVAAATGFSPNQPLDLNDPVVLQKLTNAIIQHEDGSNPYSQDQIQQSITAGQGALATAGAFPINAGGSGAMAAGGGDKTVNVHTGDINVQTQATDAGGIASAIGAELQNQFRTAMSNFDDGVYA